MRCLPVSDTKSEAVYLLNMHDALLSRRTSSSVVSGLLGKPPFLVLVMRIEQGDNALLSLPLAQPAFLRVSVEGGSGFDEPSWVHGSHVAQPFARRHDQLRVEQKAGGTRVLL
jgi:hypothetical protein